MVAPALALEKAGGHPSPRQRQKRTGQARQRRNPTSLDQESGRHGSCKEKENLQTDRSVVDVVMTQEERQPPIEEGDTLHGRQPQKMRSVNQSGGGERQRLGARQGTKPAASAQPPDLRKDDHHDEVGLQRRAQSRQAAREDRLEAPGRASLPAAGSEQEKRNGREEKEVLPLSELDELQGAQGTTRAQEAP